MCYAHYTSYKENDFNSRVEKKSRFIMSLDCNTTSITHSPFILNTGEKAHSGVKLELTLDTLFKYVPT